MSSFYQIRASGLFNFQWCRQISTCISYTDGYHIHTILNSKALPKLEDQMTLAAAAAAAVPLTRSHFTGAAQYFSVNCGLTDGIDLILCTSESLKKISQILDEKVLSLVLFRVRSNKFSSSSVSSEMDSLKAASPSFMKSWGYSCHKGNLQDPARVYSFRNQEHRRR